MFKSLISSYPKILKYIKIIASPLLLIQKYIERFNPSRVYSRISPETCKWNYPENKAFNIRDLWAKIFKNHLQKRVNCHLFNASSFKVSYRFCRRQLKLFQELPRALSNFILASTVLFYSFTEIIFQKRLQNVYKAFPEAFLSYSVTF